MRSASSVACRRWAMRAFACRRCTPARPQVRSMSARSRILHHQARLRRTLRPHRGAARRCRGARIFGSGSQDTTFIVEEFLVARAGYVTRIEIVGGACAHIQKRSIAACGLSSYHVGSTYEAYDDTCRRRCAMSPSGPPLCWGSSSGSFDVIETERGAVHHRYECDDQRERGLRGAARFRLMAEHAAYVAARWFEHVGKLR